MKKRIIILGAVILLVVVAWIGTWQFLAGQLRQQVELLAFADGETSPQLTCGALDIAGFPFRFDIDCANAAIVTGDLLVEIPGLRASAMVYRPNHILASAQGPAKVTDAFTGQRNALAWDNIEASLRLENWRIARLSVIGDKLEWIDQLMVDTTIAQSPHAEFHLLDMPEAHNAEQQLASLAGYLRAEAVDLPGLGIAQADAEVEAELTGLPDDIRNWGAEPVLQAWQRNGGVLRLVGLRARDANADLDASGEVSLDEAGFATGSININSMGVAERIGPMIEEPWRTLVLGVPGPDGRHTNAINLRGGTISSGLVPIAAMPSLF